MRYTLTALGLQCAAIQRSSAQSLVIHKGVNCERPAKVGQNRARYRDIVYQKVIFTLPNRGHIRDVG